MNQMAVASSLSSSQPSQPPAPSFPHSAASPAPASQPIVSLTPTVGSSDPAGSAGTLKSMATTTSTSPAVNSPRHKVSMGPSLVHSPGAPKPATAEVLSLSEVFVPLESITPGTVCYLNIEV